MKGQRHLTIVIKLGMHDGLGFLIRMLTPISSLGSSSIVHEKTHEPLLSILSLIVETAVNLIKNGHRVVIVSSGAIAVGLRRMDVEKRPKHLPRIQVRSRRSASGSRRMTCVIGIGCGRTMPTYEPLGELIRPSTTTCRPNTFNKE